MYMDYAALGTSQEQIEELAKTNRVVRYSLRAVKTAFLMETLMPVMATAVTVLGLIALSGINALAQTGGGAPVFTPDTGQFGRSVVGWVRLLYVGLFILGFVGIAWFCLNLLTEKPFTKQLIGTACCWGSGLIAMAVYNASKGREVEVDATDLGGGN